MPRIKAYKGAGSIIPVDEARVSTAFRCPWTKRVFGDKKSYVKHLRSVRQDRIHARIRNNLLFRKKQTLWQQPTFKDIMDWIEMNPEFIFDNGMRNSFWARDKDKKIRDSFWMKITYLNLDWHPNCSNSHACPRGGVRNWGGRELDENGKPKPTGYPGFTGHIEFQISHDLGFGSDAIAGLGIHTGTGGGTSTRIYGYGVTFFDADWPGLVQNRTMEILADNNAWKRVRIGAPIYFR